MMLCIVTAQAQTVGVAVLTHGDAKTMFYGNSALLQAVEAATEGDVISLSPGTFHGFNNFSKSGLTIIGSGMDEGPSQTILTEFRMQANDNEEKFVKLTLKNVFIYKDAFCADNGNYELLLNKCKVRSGFQCSIAPDESSVIEMVNCVSTGWDNFQNTVLNAYNCVLAPHDLSGDLTRSRILSNCILLSRPGGVCNCYDCIFFPDDHYVLSSDVRATNCTALSDGKDFFGTQTLTNTRYDRNFDAFVEGSFYELKPELASEWVDENGEQIGIYGGPEPFSAIPNAPRFTKFNVPTRTDADGKLPVEIEIAMPAK